MSDHETRISVLEKLAESCDARREEINTRLESLESFHAHVTDKLDEHMQRDADSQLEMTKVLTQLSTSFDGLAESIKTSLAGAALAIKHETIGLTLMKVGSILAVAIAGGWALFSWISR